MDGIGRLRRLPSRPRWAEELPIKVLAKLVAEHPEAARRVPEAVGYIHGRFAVDEVGPEGLVLAVGGVAGLDESPGLCR